MVCCFTRNLTLVDVISCRMREMRQYWRDLESSEQWQPAPIRHRLWWRQFLKDTGGMASWYEAYWMSE